MYDQKDSEQYLAARLQDAVRLGEHRTVFIGFLDESEAAFAQEYMKRMHFSRFLLWGGYENAERMLLGVFPEYEEISPQAFPISSITASYRRCDALSHRDFLGAFLSSGVQRAAVGDILPEEGRCVLFVRSENEQYFLTQISKIGNTGVQLKSGYENKLPNGRKYSPFSGIAASARIDCVSACAAGISRSAAAQMVSSGNISINHKETRSTDTAVSVGDVLSIRSKGRYIIDELGPETRKGKLHVSGRKYI